MRVINEAALREELKRVSWRARGSCAGADTGPYTQEVWPELADKIIAAIRRAEGLEKPTLPVGVSVLLTNPAQQLLVAKRKNNSGTGLLSTPGGRLEVNENIFTCAAREFAEECQASLGAVEIIGWREHFRYGNHYIMFYAHATGYVGTISNGIPDKSDDWEWRDMFNLTPENCTEPLDILGEVRQRLFCLSLLKNESRVPVR